MATALASCPHGRFLFMRETEVAEDEGADETVPRLVPLTRFDRMIRDVFSEGS